MYIPVIGAGSIGRRHHENLVTLGVRSDLLPWRGFDAAAFRACAADAVVIATATPVRLELVQLCRYLDLPFYIEKPLAHETATASDRRIASGTESTIRNGRIGGKAARRSPAETPAPQR